MQNLGNLSSLHLEIIEKKGENNDIGTCTSRKVTVGINDNQDNIDNKNNTIGMCTPNHFSIRQ